MPSWTIKKHPLTTRLLNSNSLSRFLLIATMATLSSTAAHSELQSYTASYDAKISGLSPTLHRKLEKTGENSWQLSQKVSILLFGVKEKAQFDMDGYDVIPQSYSIHETFSKNSELRFDRENKTVTDKLHSKEPLSLTTSAWDELSLQVQIQSDFNKLGDAYSKKNYPLVHRTKIEILTVEKIGEERISTPAGDFNAIKLKRYRGDGKNHLLIWIAKDWDYLILRLQKIKTDGKIDYQLNLKQAEIAGNVIKGL